MAGVKGCELLVTPFPLGQQGKCTRLLKGPQFGTQYLRTEIQVQWLGVCQAVFWTGRSKLCLHRCLETSAEVEIYSEPQARCSLEIVLASASSLASSDGQPLASRDNLFCRTTETRLCPRFIWRPPSLGWVCLQDLWVQVLWVLWTLL